MKKSKIMCLIALVLMVALVSGLLLTANAEEALQPQEEMTSDYDKVAIDKITTEGADPIEITGDASAAAAQKEWYEYITYSSTPIGQVSFSAEDVLVFYDPYDYSSSLIMDLETPATFDTMNSYTEEYSTSTTLSMQKMTTATANTAVTRQNGVDTTYGYSGGYATNSETSWKDTVDTSFSNTAKVAGSVYDKAGVEAGVSDTVSAGIGEEIIVGGEIYGLTSKTKLEANESVTVSEKVTAEVGSSLTTEDTLTTSTDTYAERAGNSSKSVYEDTSNTWTIVADRLTVSTGYSTSVSSTVSTTETTTVSKTFYAAYFSASGAPLPWGVATYKVKMPLYYQELYFINGEWVVIESGYCLLTTVQGACRCWIENNNTYYEHWGTGDKVLKTDFWTGFFDATSLKNAYETRLYPN